MPLDADIVVVGAGPAGATTAALAARAGARVLLLDRARFPRPKPCAEYMSPGVLDQLRSARLERAVLERKPQFVAGMDVVSPRGARFRLRYERDGHPVHAMTLRRLDLDHALLCEAADAGVEVIEGAIVREPALSDGAVRGVLMSQAGTGARVTGAVVVVADGARSAMRTALGLSRTVRWPSRLGLVAHYHGGEPMPGDVGQMHVSSLGYCGLAPLPGAGINVGLVVHAGGRGIPRLPATRIMDDWIQSHPALATLLEGHRRVSSVRGMSPVGARSRACAGPGFLMVGDAAGFFDPFTGEGIHRAILGGRIAAAAALEAVNQGQSAAQIEAYHRARHAAFRQKEMVTALVQAFVRIPGLLDYALPRLESRPLAGGLLASVLGDVADAGQFLRPRPLWDAVRP